MSSRELAELINLCIAPYHERPESRQLLKHPYFDSVRAAKGMSSRSEAALLAAAGGSLEMGGSEYGGSIQSTGVSRTVSAATEAHTAHSSLGGLLSSSSRDSVHVGPSRTVSGAEHGGDRALSDNSSIRSQRSNASELAGHTLADIAEDGGSAGCPASLMMPCPWFHELCNPTHISALI